MEFKFTPVEDKKSYREYLDCINSRLVDIISVESWIGISVMAIFVTLFTKIFSYYHKGSIIFVAILTIVLAISYFIMYLIKKYKKSNKNSFGKYKALYNDFNTTFYFSMDDEYLTRTNEFSTIKVKKDKVKEIIELQRGIILSFENVDIFIPKNCLPVPVDKFLESFPKENIKKIDYKKQQLKKCRNKYIGICIIFVLSIFIGYNIAKYNYYNDFEALNVISFNGLERQMEDQTYLYNNENFNLNIYFPEKWGAKYGIEEAVDSINVYYLPDEVQTQGSCLLFKVVKGEVYDEEYIAHRFFYNKDGEIFTFLSPKELNIFPWFAEEYFKMNNDISSIKVE